MDLLEAALEWFVIRRIGEAFLDRVVGSYDDLDRSYFLKTGSFDFSGEWIAISPYF